MRKLLLPIWISIITMLSVSTVLYNINFNVKDTAMIIFAVAVASSSIGIYTGYKVNR